MQSAGFSAGGKGRCFRVGLFDGEEEVGFKEICIAFDDEAVITRFRDRTPLVEADVDAIVQIVDRALYGVAVVPPHHETAVMGGRDTPIAAALQVRGVGKGEGEALQPRLGCVKAHGELILARVRDGLHPDILATHAVRAFDDARIQIEALMDIGDVGSPRR